MNRSVNAYRRPIYGTGKRLKRGVLRTLGLWSRQHYDVEVVVENGQATYKKITFKSERQAERVSANLERYGDTPHLPSWRRREGNIIWVDYVQGQPCHRVDDTMMPQIARCFGQIANRDSRLQTFEATPYWQRHLDNLDFLSQTRVIGHRLRRELQYKSRHARPDALRTGFDYGDPIGPNLLSRDECGTICAIDVKNLHSDTLIGEGLAKASDRWMCRERRAVVFAHLNRLGLADIERAFDFIAIYERTARVKRKTERDLQLHRRVRSARAKRRQLAMLLD